MSNETSRIVVFRADASTAIGGGHVSRCLALAEALTAGGARCVLATGPETRTVVRHLEAFDGEPIELPAGADGTTEAATLAHRFPDGVDWLVVDHYGRDASFERLCRPWARRILSIDDLADRPHDCDVLLDQTSAGRAEAYRPLVPADCRLLLGPAFAPLRRQFREYRRRRARPDAAAIRRVFVSFGAVDTRDLSSTALSALADAGFGVPVDVVIGRTAPHRQSVERLAAGVPFPVTVHSDVDDMAGLMAAADLAIGAAGVTSWERCALGLPAIVVVVADNQRLVAAELGDRGAAQVLGEADDVSTADIAEALRALAAALHRRQAMARAASAICDGLGAERVRAALSPPIRAAGDRPVELRPATLEDADLLLRWQANPNTRRFARNPAAPDAATHEAWLRARLADPDCLLNIAMLDGTPTGALRLDRDSAADGAEGWEISIYVDPAHYRKGIAKAALALARRLLPDAVFLADVLPDNAASHALFTGAGYARAGARYEQRPPRTSKRVGGRIAS
jgi:UDP-2,4-diacetamido-2,4,6-trideoxy-beta-L-altropyranose hydrolase